MKTLMQFKLESDRLRAEAGTFKTKSAQLKRYDKARAIEREAGDLMNTLFKIGQVLTIERSTNCTTPSGGGWNLGKGAQVEVMTVYNDQLVVSCDNTVFYLYLLGPNSHGWCSNNIFTFTEYLASQGQGDIQRAEAQHSLDASLKSFHSAYRCRHADGLKKSGSFRARLKQQLQWARDAKLALFKLNVESITHADVIEFRATKAVSRE